MLVEKVVVGLGCPDEGTEDLFGEVISEVEKNGVLSWEFCENSAGECWECFCCCWWWWECWVMFNIGCSYKCSLMGRKSEKFTMGIGVEWPLIPVSQWAKNGKNSSILIMTVLKIAFLRYWLTVSISSACFLTTTVGIFVGISVSVFVVYSGSKIWSVS